MVAIFSPMKDERIEVFILNFKILQLYFNFLWSLHAIVVKKNEINFWEDNNNWHTCLLLELHDLHLV